MARRKYYFLVVMFLMLLLVAAGCGSDDTSSSEGESTDKETETETSTEEEETEEADEQVAEAGGELRIAFYQRPPSLDPHVSTSAANGMITRHIYEGLMAPNENSEPEPMLAESVDVSDDGETYTFNLREGVMFHNDKEMTAEDVVASMERWVENNSSVELIYGGSSWKAVDDYTVELHLETAKTGVLDTLVPVLQAPAIMPKEVIESADAAGITEYVGTGPFQMEEYLTDQHVHLTKFADYEAVDTEASGLAGKKEALLDDIYFEFVTDASTRIAGITSGEYDVAYNIPYDSYEMLDSDPNINTLVALGSPNFLIFNKKNKLFQDQTLRQAVAAALDVEEILQASYVHEDFYELDHGYMSQHTDWYSEAGEEYYNQGNIEKAKELLEEAGYDGEEFTMLTSQDVPTNYSAAVVIQEQMKQIGVNVTIGDYDWATVSELREDPDEWGFYVNGATEVNIPAQVLVLGPSMGWGSADDEHLVNLHNDIIHAGSEEEAKELWDELHEYAWSEYMPAAKIGNTYSLNVARDNIEGITTYHSLVLWNTTKTD